MEAKHLTFSIEIILQGLQHVTPSRAKLGVNDIALPKLYMTSAILQENCGYSPSSHGLLGKLAGVQSYKVKQSYQQLQIGRECHEIPKPFPNDIEPSQYDIPKPLGEHADPRTIQIVHQILRVYCINNRSSSLRLTSHTPQQLLLDINYSLGELYWDPPTFASRFTSSYQTKLQHDMREFRPSLQAAFSTRGSNQISNCHPTIHAPYSNS